MLKKWKLPQIKFKNRKNMIYAIVVAVGVLLLMDFNTRLTRYFEISTQRDHLKAQVQDLKMTEQILYTQIAYATSEPAVEDWARAEGHMIKPGDISIVPLVSANATPIAMGTPSATPEAVKNWEVWKALLLDR